MSHDYELRRLTDQIKKLTEEQQRINRRILQSRRDEQFDLDHIRRRYSSQIQQMEERQRHLNKDMERRERELHALQNRARSEESSDKDDHSSTFSRHLRRV